jgi:hypothetical protein
MTLASTDQPLKRQAATDLKAAVAARRELDDDLEDHVLESFLARIDARIQARVDEEMARQGGAQPKKRAPRQLASYEAPAVVAGSLALAIPLMGVAADSGAQGGVLLTVILVNMLYFLFGRRS